MMISWALYRDASCAQRLHGGEFPVAWATARALDAQADGASSFVDPMGPRVVRRVREEVAELLTMAPVGGRREFPIPRGDVHLPPALAEAPHEAETEDLHCVLCLRGDVAGVAGVGADAERPASLASSWFGMKLERAAMYRQRANDHFKDGDLAMAIKGYRRALKWLECPENCTFSASEAQGIHALAIPCHTNLATCFWKQEIDMDACIRHCDAVLTMDPDHTKALYRRSQARLRTKAFAGAVEDLQRCLLIEPASSLFQTSLAKAKHAEQAHRGKEKQAFAGMFHG